MSPPLKKPEVEDYNDDVNEPLPTSANDTPEAQPSEENRWNTNNQEQEEALLALNDHRTFEEIEEITTSQAAYLLLHLSDKRANKKPFATRVLSERIATAYCCSERKWYGLLDPRREVDVASISAPVPVVSTSAPSSLPCTLPRGISIPAFHSIPCTTVSSSSESTYFEEEEEEEEEETVFQRVAGVAAVEMNKRIRTMVGDIRGRNVHPRMDTSNSFQAPSIPSIPTIQNEGGFVRSVNPLLAPPPLAVQQESAPTTTSDPQTNAEEFVPWRLRRFTGAHPIPASISFLNDAKSAHIISRGIMCKADTQTTRNMNIKELIGALSHNLIRAIIHHNALQDHQSLREQAMMVLRNEFIESRGFISGLQAEIEQLKKTEAELRETVEKQTREVAVAKVENLKLAESLKVTKESLVAVEHAKVHAVEEMEKEVREEYQALFNEAEQMIYSLGYRDGSSNAPPRKPLCDLPPEVKAEVNGSMEDVVINHIEVVVDQTAAANSNEGEATNAEDATADLIVIL